MFLISGGTANTTGSRADKERESYQERTAPTETECKQHCSKGIEVPILYVFPTAGRGTTEGEPDCQTTTDEKGNRVGRDPAATETEG